MFLLTVSEFQHYAEQFSKTWNAVANTRCRRHTDTDILERIHAPRGSLRQHTAERKRKKLLH